MASTQLSTRRPYHGSCHCGAIQYVVQLTFPPNLESSASSIRIYKCNCSTCHKMGLFHLRPINPVEDFVLVKPTNLNEELGDYRCNKRAISWFFCKVCGVRCFSFGGEGEVVDLDLDKWLGKTDTEGMTTKIWRPKGGEWRMQLDEEEWVRPGCYLSINATSIEPGQEGFSLKEWTEKGWISYIDAREKIGQMRLGEPYEGGMY